MLIFTLLTSTGSTFFSGDKRFIQLDWSRRTFCFPAAIVGPTGTGLFSFIICFWNNWVSIFVSIEPLGLFDRFNCWSNWDLVNFVVSGQLGHIWQLSVLDTWGPTGARLGWVYFQFRKFYILTDLLLQCPSVNWFFSACRTMTDVPFVGTEEAVRTSVDPSHDYAAPNLDSATTGWEDCNTQIRDMTEVSDFLMASTWPTLLGRECCNQDRCQCLCQASRLHRASRHDFTRPGAQCRWHLRYGGIFP